jgi:Ca2+-binding RTX toxin-like protein
VLLVVPAQAQAGFATVEGKSFLYNSFAGEVNDVTITRESDLVLRVQEKSGLGAVAGEGCTRTSSDEVVFCTYTGTSKRVTFLPGQVYLHDGNDRARGPLVMHGGDGDDEIVFEYEFFDELFGYAFFTNGDAGNDTITGLGEGGEGNDTLRALPGRRAALAGGPGDDRLEGGTLDDTLSGGNGSDHVVSGGGTDLLLFDEDSHLSDFQPDPPVTLSLENGAQGGRAGENDTYDGVFTNVRVGDAPGSTVTGNDLRNAISGLGTIRGLGGDDRLIGGFLHGQPNHDTIDGGPGDDVVEDGDLSGDSDTLIGGDGDDRLVAYDQAEESENTNEREMAPTRDELSCGPGVDRIDVDNLDPRPADCEIVALVGFRGSTITGTRRDDVLPGFSGDGAADRILAGSGDDVVEGRGGNDQLFGQDGDDRLVGESAGAPFEPPITDLNADVISGGSGADHVIGGFGADRLTGGPGSDRFSGGDANDTIGARDGTRDKVRCGRGRDRVIADRGDRVAGDCEVVVRR